MTTAAAGSGWHLGHLVRKIRLDKGLSIEALARLTRLSTGEVLAVEENQIGQVPSLYLERLKKIEAVLGVDFLRARPIEITGNSPTIGETGTVYPFATTENPIHQNSMEWSLNGRLLDVCEHMPQVGGLPPNALRQWIGKKVPTDALEKYKATAQTRVEKSSSPNPASLWTHYQRHLIAASRDEATPPLRYNASLYRGSRQRISRKVTAIRLSSGIYETRTHIIPLNKKIDVPCCEKFQSCGECFLATPAALLKKATG